MPCRVSLFSLAILRGYPCLPIPHWVPLFLYCGIVNLSANYVINIYFFVLIMFFLARDALCVWINFLNGRRSYQRNSLTPLLKVTDGGRWILLWYPPTHLTRECCEVLLNCRCDIRVKIWISPFPAFILTGLHHTGRASYLQKVT